MELVAAALLVLVPAPAPFGLVATTVPVVAMVRPMEQEVQVPLIEVLVVEGVVLRSVLLVTKMVALAVLV
jgi:hypothetical protein